MTDNRFNEKFETFYQGCRKILNEYMISNFPNNPKEDLTATIGRRYARIDRTVDGECRSVYAFVDTTNGDVLKPASYKAPARHARGNIYDEFNGLKYMSAYGPAYLK